MSEFFSLLKELRDKLGASRILILGILYTGLVCVLLFKLYSLQIVHGKEYLDNYIQMTEKTVSTPAARGRIFDKNGNLLAYNVLSYSVVIQDNGDYTSAEKNQMLYRLIRILNENGETVDGDFKVRIGESGKYEYTASSESSRKGFLRDVYGLKSISALDDAAGKYPSDISAEELVEREYNYFGLNKMTDSEGEPLELTRLEKLQLVNIRYTMSLTAYRKYESTVISSGISESTKIKVLENSGNMIGVDIQESTQRVYNDAIYFSSIIGYIGKVQEDQLGSLQERDPAYTANDNVGRIGIEQYMEYELHGTKGSRSMYVDNVGHIMDIIEEVDSQAGQDVYLTIDRDLQIGIYHLLEQQLAGILHSKIVMEDDPNAGITDGSKLRIPVKDVYYQLIANNVLDMEHFASDDASSVEKEIYGKFKSSRGHSLVTIKNELTSETPLPLNELSDDINAYMIYIYNRLVEEDIIMPDLIDTGSDYYLAWKADTLSMREFLYAGIADNWLDSSVLDVGSRYSDSDDIFMALVSRIDDILAEDKGYDKLNYKYLIKNGVITGRELCMAMLDQGVVEYSVEAYDELSSHGENYAYEYILQKIRNIEITPAQLALDPCTAGCVVTDVNTGEVRALVSYPGYDNNRLTNSMDIDYYYSLLNDQSLPLYNNATQAKKAPGSTFKPITAVAALEEGVVSSAETINCTGIYEEINPPIRCWTYPGFHGPLDTVGGIMNSCNYYFSELGHRLSTDSQGNYSADLGIEKIHKYAAFFGLDHKSGVEITEIDPSITTENPEQSAMGQGTHSYANVQLSRYVSAIANRGTVYELSVLDKTTDSQGVTIQDYSPEVYSKINIKEDTWNVVQLGMRQVIAGGSARNIFKDLRVNIAGKTGTAQESKSRANHAFFISFGPYENPQIAVTVNIPYGYSSSNAASVASSVYSFYFRYITLDDILTGGALNVYNVTIGD